MKCAHHKGLMDRESCVAQFVVLAIFTIGVVSTLGSDDLLAAFAAGESFRSYISMLDDDKPIQDPRSLGMATSKFRSEARSSLPSLSSFSTAAASFILVHGYLLFLSIHPIWVLLLGGSSYCSLQSCSFAAFP